MYAGAERLSDMIARFRTRYLSESTDASAGRGSIDTQIHFFLECEERLSDRALFDLAIGSKLRG